MTKHIPHEFLTLNDLQSFNESVDHVSEKTPQSFEFNTFIGRPSELSDDIAYQLSDIVDKKTQLDDRDYTNKAFKAPNTIDRILGSLYVAYVAENGIPVAVATLVDPTVENYKGIIPSDFYALKSATNLDGRLQQEFFTVVDEKQGLGIAAELRRILEDVSPDMFTTVPVSDVDTLNGLVKNGYTFVSEFDTDWEVAPVQLWIN